MYTEYQQIICILFFKNKSKWVCYLSCTTDQCIYFLFLDINIMICLKLNIIYPRNLIVFAYLNVGKKY